MIRDQVVEKTAMPKIRERLLMEADLTLETTLELVRSIESASAIGNTLELVFINLNTIPRDCVTKKKL
jgi:hypothetical protein